MSISRKFSLLVFTIVLITIGVNIFALRYFSAQYFSEYLATLPGPSVLSFDNEKEADTNLSLIESLSLHQDILPEVIEKYKVIDSDFSKITQSLSDFVDTDPAVNRDPTLPAHISSEKQTPLTTFFTSFLHLANFSADSAEFRFATRVLESVLVVNAFLVVFVLIVTYAFLDVTFSPILRVIEKVKNISHRAESEKIEYSRRDEFGALIGAVNDLGERLARQEKIRSRFLADVSHEIRTPITSVRCYLEGIRDGVIQLDESTVKSLIFELDRLTRITSAIMEFQKLENDDVRFHYGMVDLHETLTFIQKHYAQRLSKNNQRLVFSATKKFQVFFDTDRFIQILHNIVGNFIKYAGQGTNLFISWSIEKDAYRFVFTDNGKGVAKKEIPFLSEKFYQADSSKSGDIEDRGIGVGLSIVRKIVDAAGGRLLIESDVWKGFRIEVYLPKLLQKSPWNTSL